MANTGKDASGNTIFLLAPFGTGVDNANAYVFGSGIYFQRGSVAQLPILDVSIPANNRPLPVVCLAGDGLAAYDTGAGTASATTLRVVTTPDTRQGSNGDAASKTGSNAAQLRTIADLLDGTFNKTELITFTISTGTSSSGAVNIGAGKTVLAWLIPSGFGATGSVPTDIIFNCHPTTSGSVAPKTSQSGSRYRLSNIPVASALNMRVGATDFLGDSWIELVTVTVNTVTPANQAGTRIVTALVGVI